MAEDPKTDASRDPAPSSSSPAAVSRTVLQGILDYAPIGIWLQSPEGRLLFVNRTYCDAVGISEERFLAVAHYSELYDETTARNCMESDRAALAQDGPHTSHERLRFVDGRLHEVEIVKAKLRSPDGQPAGIIALATDVTERRQTDRQLRESQSRLAGIVESAMDAIVTVDEQQRIVLFNSAAETLFGCPAAEVMGQSLDRFIPARHRERHHQDVRGFAETGRTTRTMGRLAQITALRANGEEFPCEASISRLEVHGRKFLTVIMRDTTERVRAETARADLEAKVRQAQKMEALGTLAGGIAHDFNNILSVVLMNAELALPLVGPLPEAVQCLDAIARAGERARDLVRRILAFSRKQPQKRALMDLGPTLEEAGRFMRAALPAGVDLAVSIGSGVPRVRADATEIHQVAINLCTNAWQALGGKHGRIEMRLEGVFLKPSDVTSEPELHPGPYAMLSVSDTGHGMDEATRERIFEPFFTTKELGQGTGLGLSVVHGIVKQMGGAIDVHSRPAQGSTFRVFFPAGEPSAEKAAPGQASAAAATGAGERVLFVDDEEPVARIAARILERAGFSVTCFFRPESALAAFRAAPDGFDVVVADLNMPGMSGIDLAHELRRIRPEVPLVLTTGNLTREMEVEADKLGVRRVLEKPYSTAELREMVTGLVRSAGR